MNLLLSLFFLQFLTLLNSESNTLLNFIQCQICSTVRLEGRVSDCDCDFRSVDDAVQSFFVPILQDITSRTFFRYFRVNLDRPCPFWNEDGHCTMEGCSVCTCAENEIPSTWLNQDLIIRDAFDDNFYSAMTSSDNDFGWIIPDGDKGGLSNTMGLSRLNFSSPPNDQPFFGDYVKYLRDTEDDDDFEDWTDMPEGEECPLDPSQSGSYVNLLQNPEQFTGYGGLSARRVWSSIQQENCFGGHDDVCLEKRLFFRLMSGLQASISAHIAKEYYFPDGRWGHNIPLFVRAVGSHKDRMNNLYFTFLFVLRAVVKSGDLLTGYYFDTGNREDDKVLRESIRQLVSRRLPVDVGNIQDSSGYGYREAMVGLVAWAGSSQQQQQAVAVTVSEALEQCRNGFDESILFQVPGDWSGTQYWQGMQEKIALKEEFRDRFRNISRIMDCVTCEKCRVWGKLQILGLGTAIKILLTPEEELSSRSGVLNRQEIIALINTLHQLSKSVEFAAKAPRAELSSKLQEVGDRVLTGSMFAGLFIFVPYVLHKAKTWLSRWKR